MSYRARLPIALALVVAALATDALAKPTTGRLAFKVLQFNVRFDFASDKAAGNAWSARVERVAGAIRESGASVACLQEDKQDQVEDLKNALPGWEFVGKGRDGRASERCSVAFDTKHWSCTANGDFWLSNTPEVPNSNTWGTKYPHKVTWAELEARGDSKKRRVLVLSTHFDEDKALDTVRTQSARVIRDWLAANAKGKNVILGGDFNAAPTDACHEVLTDLGLKDAWAQNRDPLPGTVHDFTGRSTKRRIDWLLTGGRVATLDARLHKWTTKDGKWPSDHYPVLAEVEVAPEPASSKKPPVVNANR